MEFRKGDVVSVEAVVDFATAGQVYLSAGGRAFDIAAGSSVIKLLRRAFVVGERVRWASVVGDVICVHGEWLWLDSGDGYTQTVPAAECTSEPPAAILLE